MKTINGLIISAGLAFILAGAGCNKGGKLNEPSTVKPTDGPIELKLKWPVGETIVQEMKMTQAMDMTMASQPAPIKQSTSINQQYGLNVLKDLPDGGHEVQMEFLGVAMKMDMGGKTMMDFDSAKKDSASASDPMVGMFGKIVGAKITYFLNATNGVDRIEGVEDLSSRLTEGAPNNSAGFIKGMMNETYFKQMMSQNSYLPDKPVQKGDTWPVEMDYAAGPIGALTFDYKFTFQDWEKHGERMCVRLDFDATIKSKMPSTPNASGMSITKLTGTSTGSCWFDPEIGMFIDNSMKQDLDMAMTITAGGQSQSISTHMDQDIDVKMLSVK